MFKSQPVAIPLARHAFTGRDGRHLYVYGALHRRPGADWPEAEMSGIHLRRDVLTSSWVAVSPVRNVRPNDAVSASEPRAEGCASCPLCPGGAEVPFEYDAAVIDNRFPSLLAEPPPVGDDPRLAQAVGRCEVVLYTSRHEGNLATLTPAEAARVMAVWRERTTELWADPRHAFVLAFENRGEGVGATIAHPHGQIYAFGHLPPFIERRLDALERHRAESGACLACQVLADDAGSPRLIEQDDAFVLAVPFAPRWPYEVHVRARRHGAGRLADLTSAEARSLVGALRRVVARYDGLFGFELPYMMEILEAPAAARDWHLAVEFYPPHRNRQQAKLRASVETTTGLFILDALPEETAAALRAVQVEARPEHPGYRGEVPRATSEGGG